MTTTNYANDIPTAAARAAHNGTSFVPERRAEQEREDYRQTLQSDFEQLETLADTEQKRAQLAEEFELYRAGYRQRTLAYLAARSRVMSTMITGPARFPTARNEKRCNSADNRLRELIDFRERALKAIRRTLQPELRPIMAGDADATARLAEKIIEAKAMQELMRSVNAAHKRYLKDPATLDACELSDQAKQIIRDYKPQYSWEPHPFAPYQLKNNNANIRRMEQRLAQLEQAHQTPETVTEAGDIRIEDCPADNRVRLFFPGKPDAEICDRLKSSGFRWAPSIGCWQEYRNGRSLAVAQGFAPQTAE